MTIRGKQRDKNEPEIIAALRAVGCSVVQLHEPVDLLLGFRGRNWLVEVKNPPGPRGGTGSDGQKLNANQEKFFEDWRGQVCKVTSVATALELVDRWVTWRDWKASPYMYIRQSVSDHCSPLGYEWDVSRDAASRELAVAVRWPGSTSWFETSWTDETMPETTYLQAAEQVRRLVFKVRDMELRHGKK